MRRSAVLATALLVLAACSRTDVAATGGRHAWTQAHVLRVADISDPDTLNPYFSQLDLSYFLTSLAYSYLVISDSHGHLIGDLATAVPSLHNGGISADGKAYTYHLHRGVLWQDGARFTSRDVAASWQAVMNPRNNTLHREGYDVVRSIDTPDDYTVIVHLKERYPPFETQFFAPLQEGGKPILPAHILRAEKTFDTGSLATHPIGTGPFAFVRWDRGDQLIYRRFDRYFKGRPKLQEVRLLIVPNDQSILTQMRTHQIDLVLSPPSALADDYRSLDGVHTALDPWNAQAALVFNVRKRGLDDVAVRQAIAYAIDYSALIQKISHGVGEVAYNTLPVTAIGYEKFPAHEYDPARADRLLDAAGWKRGSDGIRMKAMQRLSFTLATITGSSSIRDVALLLQAYLHAVGIDMQIKNYPYDQIYAPSGPIYGGAYDLSIFSTTLGWDPDIHFYVGCDQWYPRGENIYGYCNPALDAWERRGLQSDDTARRAVAYRAAGRIMWREGPYLPIYNLQRLVVRSVDLRGFSTNPTSTPWWNAWQWDI
jgi:peptide/nickel transport system substrate-binding protein